MGDRERDRASASPGGERGRELDRGRGRERKHEEGRERRRGRDRGHGLRIGVDIGGTFTDVMAFDPDTGAHHRYKVPSTPARLSAGVVDGIEAVLDRLGYDPADVSAISHGSTVTTNALIERTGAPTGLLLTEGFDAIPVAGRGSRPQEAVKNPRYVPPEPLVRGRHVRGVPERVNADGDVAERLDEAATRDAIAELRADGIDAIAVCLLFSFLYPDHERRVADLIRDVHPECTVALSSAVAPRIREYPRLSTTVVSAYVAGTLGRYLADLERSMAERGLDPDELVMMLSHGGLAGFDDASRAPAHTLLSGPAAGVQGALFAAELSGDHDVVTMDMGGTSCDVAIAPGGEPLTTTERTFGGNPVSVPMVDIRAIGAGGGTVARVDGGRLRVGPDSAGADPGPVCYGRGGEQVTVTDADAVLGRLSPSGLLDGDLPIDVAAAEAAIESRIADPLGLSVTAAAAGVVDVVDEKMKKELSLALARGGHDPRTFSLVAYGGAGPMHAPAVARELSIPRVVVPPWPGINSAVGLLTTDRKRLYERSHVARLSDAPLRSLFDDLVAEARGDAADAGTPADAVSYHRELELRYAGQSYELEVPVHAGEPPASIRDRFDEAHRSAFGRVSDEPVETVTYRVTSRVETETLTGDLLGDGEDHGADEASSEVDGWREAPIRRVYFDGTFRDAPVYRRERLPAGASFDGPAVVEQLDTTTVVAPGITATVGHAGTLVLEAVSG